MKYVNFLICFCFIQINLAIGQDTIAETGLRVIIENIKSENGNIQVGLYDSEGNWLAQTYKGVVSEISNDTATALFEDIPAGTYGISLYHDENENEILDSGIFGIPKEPYACSNQAKGRFGPPKWSDAKFIFDGNHLEIIIKL